MISQENKIDIIQLSLFLMSIFLCKGLKTYIQKIKLIAQQNTLSWYLKIIRTLFKRFKQLEKQSLYCGFNYSFFF